MRIVEFPCQNASQRTSSLELLASFSVPELDKPEEFDEPEDIPFVQSESEERSGFTSARDGSSEQAVKIPTAVAKIADRIVFIESPKRTTTIPL